MPRMAKRGIHLACDAVLKDDHARHQFVFCRLEISKHSIRSGASASPSGILQLRKRPERGPPDVAGPAQLVLECEACSAVACDCSSSSARFSPRWGTRTPPRLPRWERQQLGQTSSFPASADETLAGLRSHPRVGLRDKRSTHLGEILAVELVDPPTCRAGPALDPRET